MNLLLFGFKRCGKTYLGLKVAQKMHMHFLDTDQMIEDLFTARHHKTLTCREIVHNHGVHFFRELEKQVIYSLENTTNTVIALGGGSVLDQANVEHLKAVGTLIYLKTDKNILKERILSGQLPFYINPKDAQGSFEAMYQERQPIYEKIPSLVINTSHEREEDIIDKLCAFITALRS